MEPCLRYLTRGHHINYAIDSVRGILGDKPVLFRKYISLVQLYIRGNSQARSSETAWQPTGRGRPVKAPNFLDLQTLCTSDYTERLSFYGKRSMTN